MNELLKTIEHPVKELTCVATRSHPRFLSLHCISSEYEIALHRTQRSESLGAFQSSD